MGGVKPFESITLDTFATFLTRVGLSDQVHAEVMEDVRLTGQRVLTLWRDQFVAWGVPQKLIQRLELHQQRLPLAVSLVAHWYRA